MVVSAKSLNDHLADRAQRLGNPLALDHSLQIVPQDL
jgi:hypothetical protein